MLVYALASMVVRPVCLCAAAKELLISIMSFEGMIVIEACIETWDLAGRSWMQASHRFGLGEAAYGPILIAGDSFFFVSVLNLRHERSWASAMAAHSMHSILRTRLRCHNAVAGNQAAPYL